MDSGDRYACVPYARLRSYGECDICSFAPCRGARPHADYPRRRRWKFLDQIDKHEDIRELYWLTERPAEEDCFLVCRVCYFLIKHKGRQHYATCEHTYHRFVNGGP
jgi:hypothetical protein